MLLNPIYNEFNYFCICLQWYIFFTIPQALNNICEEIVSKPKPRVDSPMDENIQPERPHNKKRPEDVSMEYTDFVQNEANNSHANI